jgi:E3 ubiquitin-protein ligase MARCH6
MLVVGWLTIHVAVTLLLAGPILVGRAAFARLTDADLNEIYTFGAGCGLLRLAAAVVWYGWRRATLEKLVRTPWLTLGARKLGQVAVQSCKLSVAVAVGGVALPLLAGLVLDMMIIIPVKVPGGLSPVYSLWQDWAIGLMALKLVHEAGMAGAPARWKEPLRQATANGISGLELGPVLALLLPAVAALLGVLAAPYLLARGLLPLLGVGPKATAAVFRWVFPGVVLAAAGAVAADQLYRSVIELCNNIRDDNYLVGQTLLNADDHRVGGGGGGDGSDGGGGGGGGSESGGGEAEGGDDGDQHEQEGGDDVDRERGPELDAGAGAAAAVADAASGAIAAVDYRVRANPLPRVVAAS